MNMDSDDQGMLCRIGGVLTRGAEGNGQKQGGGTGPLVYSAYQ